MQFSDILHDINISDINDVINNINNNINEKEQLCHKPDGVPVVNRFEGKL